MKNLYFIIFSLIILPYSGYGQILVKTDFSAGLPSGWTNTNIQGTQKWTFRSAPSLSSASGGQYAVFDDAALGGVKPNEAALTTPTLNCTGRTNVIVSFYHFWDDVENTHAYVEVSNDNGTTWTEVYNDGFGIIGSLAAPDFQKIDISSQAAGFSQVKVRFRYTDGNVSGKVWYLDDVTIYSDPDVGITDLVAPIYSNCSAKIYTSTEDVIVKVFNYSAEDIASTPVTCEITVGGVTQTLTGTTGVIPANSSINFNIGNIDMTVEDVYHFNIYTTLGTDTYIANNSYQTGRKPITTIFPYSEDFNTSKSGWYNSAAISTRQLLWGTMPDLGGADGEGSSWYFYLSSGNTTDKPYVESPVFDFTYLTNPALSLDIKSSVDGNGGAQIQYSIDGGAWTILGTSSDPNWYTGNAWTMNNCWTNTNAAPLNTWTTKKYNCCVLSGQSCVKFRIYSFAWYTDAPRRSFAFDNFKISESQKDDIKVVMIENPSAGGCAGFTAAEPVKIKVYNNTCKSITNIPITIELSGANTQSISDEITGPLNRFSNLSYTLSNTFDMSNPGNYTLKAYIDKEKPTGTSLDFYRDTVQTNDSIIDYRYSKISTYPYVADFNSGSMGWSTGKDGADRFFTRSSVTFLSGAQGQGDSWYLDFYNPGNNTNKAWVESPPFDLTGLTNPILYVDMKYSFDGNAGASVEFSTNGGSTWSPLGTISDPYWHNGNAWTMNNCVTTSSSSNWTTKQHSLCSYKTATCIKFRIRAFAWYTDDARRSFAFDNFRIQDNILDVAVTNIIQPDASLVGCLYDANQKVTVKVYNWNCSDYSNVSLKCDVTGVVSANLSGTLLNAVNNNYSTFQFPGNFDMTGVGTYNFSAYSDDASDDFRKNDTTKLTITTTVPKIVTFPYSEDFNSGQGGWINSAATGTRQMLLGSMPDLGGADGEGDSWYLYLSSGNNTNKPYVESPVFDFTYMTKPTLYLDVKYSFDGNAGAQVQYSLDGGTSWNILGVIGEPNWYTGNAWTMNNCWTNNSGSPVSTWTTMKRHLCELSGKPCVKFRIYSFAWYTDAPRRSFAFDNIVISDSQKDDLELQLFEAPGSGSCAGFSNTENVRIKLFNNTCKPITNIPVTCELSGAATQTILGSIPGQISRFSSYTYTFGSTLDMSAAGNYQIKAYINKDNELGTDLDYYRDTVQTNDTIVEERFGILNTFPYLADFNNGVQGWTSGKDAADRFMVHGAMPDLNGAEGEGESWYLEISGGNTTNKAWVISPKFNLTGLTNPILYMDVKYSLDGNAGGQVQYSTNSGGTWQDLGNSTPPDWYNGNSWTMNNCFMGNNANPTNKWTTKQYRLCEIGASTCVMFRVRAFAWYTDEARSSFAFDNFRIQDNTIDVKVTQITEPDAAIAGCLYENAQQVTVKVYNWNCSSVANVPVQCDVSGITSATLNGTVPTIPAHDYATYQIPGTFDMTPVGVYKFSSYTKQIGDDLVDNDTTKLSITVTVPKISTFPYLADFNGTTNSWLRTPTTGDRQMIHGVMPDLGGAGSEGDSWYFDAPSGNNTNKAYVRSPVFNFAGKTNLFIFMDIKYSFDGNAGAQIEYSTNGGANWTIIGAIGEPTWYDGNAWTMNTCWTGNSASPQNTWRTVMHNICILDNNPCVIFRVTSFAWYTDAPRSSFAFDNFRVVENYQDVTADQFRNHSTANDKCIYPGTQNIQVRYYNVGCTDATSVPIKCEVSGAISQTYTATLDIPAKSFVDYTFTPTFSYDNNGSYDIEATIDLPGDNEESNDTVNITTNIFYHNKITTFPYLEDFNSGFGDWTPSANINGREIRAGAFPYLNGSETNAGTCYFYQTSTSNNTDKTWVESPVFDITGLTNPILSMEIKWAFDNNAGVQVEYSTDGGVSYQPLGVIGEPTWHTGNAWTLNNCWTNNSGSPQNAWKVVHHDLCSLVGATCLRFRIKVFAWYTDEMRSSFAFDNFTITDSPTDAEAVYITGCYGSKYGIDVQVKNNTYFCAGAMPAITNIDISYSVNGGASVTENIATNILPGATEIVTVNNITIPDISSSLKVWIKNPNGLTDEIQLNDTVEANVSIWPSCNDHCSNAVHILSKITQASQTNNATVTLAEDPAFSCKNDGPDGLPGTADDIEITKENTVWYWFSTDCDGGDVDVKFTNISGAGCSNGIQVSIDRLDAEPVCDPTNYTNVFCTFPDNKADIVWNGIALGKDEKYYITVDGVASGQCDFNIEVSGSVGFDPDRALSGTYTIDPANSNYPNFQSAFDSLQTYGVKAPVVFEAIDTVYYEQLDLSGICGVNKDTTVTFKSYCDSCVRAKIQFNATVDNYTMRLNSSKFFIFDRIDFEALDPIKSRVIELTNVNNVTFNDCYFYGDKTLADTDDGRSLIYSSGISNVDTLTFTNNEFFGGSYGLNLQNTANAIKETVIQGNIFKDQSVSAITLVKHDNPIITYNEIETNSTRDDYVGISLSDITKSLKVENNVLTSSTADGNGILFNNAVAVVGTPGTVVNNMFAIGNDAASYGLNIENSSDYLNFYFNTFNNNSAIGSGLRINTASNLILKNNIFAGAGSSADITAILTSTENNNDFFPDYGGKDVSSFNLDPDFTSITDLHTNSASLNDKGVAIAGITKDIDGETRDASPFIGADEFLGLVSWTGNTDTDWNKAGNWDFGANSTVQQIPTKGTVVSIPNVVNQPLTNSSADGLAECRNIAILSGADMEIAPKKYFTVYNNFDNAGNFTVKSDATGTGSFIPKGGYTNTGTTKMELYLSANNWHYVSSPIVNSPVMASTNFYYWDETVQDRWLQNDFVDWTDGVTKNYIMGWKKGTGTMLPSVGYAYYLFDSPKKHVFTGEFNNGDVPVSLEYTNHSATAIQDVYNGWNLVANPYPSTLNWNSDGVIKNAAVDNAIYVYNDNGTGEFNNYDYYIKGSPDSPYPSIALNASSDRCFLAPGQSAMVRANSTGAEIKITNAAREHTVSKFYKSGEKHPDLLRLEAGIDGITDEAVLRFIPSSTNKYDGEFDAIKRYSTSSKVPQLYFPMPIAELAVNTLPEITDGLVVPIGLVAGKEGKYTIKANELNFESDISIYLIDKELNKRIKLNDNPEYSFKADPENYKNRFYLVFKLEKSLSEENPEESIGINELFNENVQIFAVKKSVNIKFENIQGNDNQVIIQDVLGKKIIHQKLVSDNTILPMEKFASGNYIVKVITQSKVYEQKVFIP